METLRSLRVQKLVIKCEDELISIGGKLQVTLDNFSYGKMPAAHARKIYKTQMARAKFYCRILQKLLNLADSYNLEYDLLVYKSLADFSDYVHFFED